MKLSIAMVTYRTDADVLKRALDALAVAVAEACQKFSGLQVELWVADNDSRRSGARTMLRNTEFLASAPFAVHSQVMERNLGYGVAHNRLLRTLHSDYHLIMNPDVLLAPDALVVALQYCQANPTVVLLGPNGENEQGVALHLCKRYPTLLDLLLRGFAPGFVRRRMDQRLAAYELRDLVRSAIDAVPVDIVSGCCMLTRTAALQKVAGFSDDFFLYFEDFDLSLRMAKEGRVMYMPAMRVVHFGGHASRKGWWHIWQFVRSGITFFSRHGWRLH